MGRSNTTGLPFFVWLPTTAVQKLDHTELDPSILRTVGDGKNSSRLLAGWPRCRDGDIHPCVMLHAFLIRLCSFAAAIGILVAPLATPSARASTPVVTDAATHRDATAISGASLDAMAGMPGIAAPMDCCPPHKQKSPDCPKDCPWAPLCAAKCFPNLAASLGEHAVVLSWLPAMIPFGRDRHRDLLPEPPPPRPPRT